MLTHGAASALPPLAAAPQRWGLGALGARGARPPPPRAAAQPISCPGTATRAVGWEKRGAIGAHASARARQSLMGAHQRARRGPRSSAPGRAQPIYRLRAGVVAGTQAALPPRARRTAAPARGGLGLAGAASLDRALAPGQSTTPLARPPLLDRSASTGAWAGAGAQRPSRKLRCHSPASPGR